MSELSNPYDDVPYESFPIGVSHPVRMATIAHLMGLSPLPLEACRVLEIGCASGANIIPLAVNFPNSTFVGVDYSGKEIALGQPTLAALGLKNIELKAVNVLDIDADFGQFDYIIVHGVYSWVPEVVREKILEVCSRNLSPNGIAYVSYNTYPGWHMLRSIREMMLYHADKFKTPQERVGQARALLEYLASYNDVEKSAYSTMLKDEVNRLRNRRDDYLLHEHLASVNEPLYFHQFVANAARKNLHYIGDTQLGSMVIPNLSSFVNDTLRKVATDRIEMEQYFDFLRNVPFRRTLLTHSSSVVRPEIELNRVKVLYVSSSARPVSPSLAVASDRAEEYRTEQGASSATANRITKAAMLVLGEHCPQLIHFEKLLALARKKLPAPFNNDPKDENVLAGDLLGAFSLTLVQLYVFDVPLRVKVEQLPRANALARLQASQGWVTSQFHMSVGVDEFAKNLLPLLDGTRNHKALYADMFEIARKGKLSMVGDSALLLDESALRKVIQKSVDDALVKFGRAALLV